MPLVSTPVPRRLLRDDVHDRLRAALVIGDLAPGEQLRDVDLAEQLGVSRTPVREALLRLERAGLVATVPGRSTVVTTPDARTLREASAVVAAMHELAVREAAPLLTATDLDEMRRAGEAFAAAIASGDVEAALAADDELHGVPVRVAGNRAVADVLDQHTPSVRRAERLRFASLAGHDSVVRHARLLDHLAAGRADDAAAVERETWRCLDHLVDLTPDPATTEEHPA
ncbi:GntR family transcriptional regulator [Marmoricola sp. Leaf446]|uniref:GntR family transcriptional regulator n=1 Tax=Marmoricola sp. Leaf446 TaxID=1736379 RepID=UPI0006FB5444|nr:GntR family transcriptional regulator [Marmoricola sp. Leaf446]KQT89596.1 GntR family transcriptional regulator [Marmoricola sp. Leaf446]